MDSQLKNIEKHLKSGKKITAIQALNKYGCFRLAARINDLRNMGMTIITDTVKIKGKRIAQYYTVKGF